jgi:spore maturation protein CgeB
LTELTTRLTKMGITLHVRGDPLTISEQISLIQSSRINLSVHAGPDSRYARRQWPRPRGWGLPERCYGVPGAGGFLLSDWRFHAADDFVPGLEWASFVDIDDCVRSIRYFMTHFDEARAIAEAAHRRVIAQHTYTDRARKLITFARLWRSERLSPVPPASLRRR